MIKLRIINRHEVHSLLPMAECIEVMQAVMMASARGETSQMLRIIMGLPGDDGACFGFMPGYMADPECFGVKVTAVFPGNFGTEFQSHQGAVILFERKHGCPLAIMHGGEITGIRTAAASAVATRALARPDARTLAVLGYGEQAEMHIAAMLLVRDIERIVIWGRSPERARLFAEAQAKRHGIDMTVAETVEAAIRDADIICTTTAAAEPILEGRWIPAGCHLNVVGSSVAKFREIDTEAVVRSRLYVDYKPMTITQGGEYLVALREGAIGESHILGEIGEVLAEKCTGRQKNSDITMYKSLGMPIEDIASAMHIYRKAEQQGVGAVIDF